MPGHRGFNDESFKYLLLARVSLGSAHQWGIKRCLIGRVMIYQCPQWSNSK